ncbi:unnamed protein product, partial [Ixodes persulcatus]
VEGLALAVRRQHAEAEQVKCRGGIERERAAPDQGRLALSRAQRQHGLVQRRHGRRTALSRDSKSLTVEVEAVGYAVGEHGPAAADQGIAVNLVCVHVEGLVGLGLGIAHEDADLASPQRARVVAGVHDGLVRRLEQQAQLWVHHVRLLRVHAEELGVELGQVPDLAGPFGKAQQPCK